MSNSHNESKLRKKDVHSIRETVLSMVQEANQRTLPERRVSDKAAITVANRDLQKTKNASVAKREFSALRAVGSFISLATINKATEASLQNSDLLPVGHPFSTKAHSMTAASLRNERAKWIAADEYIDSSVRSLVIKAHGYEENSMERAHAFARLAALGPAFIPITASIDLNTATSAYTEFVFGLGLGGNSDMARRLRAQMQRRDRRGRFAFMGGGFSFSFRGKDGRFSKVSGRVVGASGDQDSIDIEVKNHPRLADGIYAMPSSRGTAVKAILDDEIIKDLPQADIDIAADDVFVDEASLTRMMAPTGWTTEESSTQGGKAVSWVHRSEDGYEVYDSPGDPFGRFQLRREQGNGARQPFPKVKSWADVQKQAISDQDLYKEYLEKEQINQDKNKAFDEAAKSGEGPPRKADAGKAWVKHENGKWYERELGRNYDLPEEDLQKIAKDATGPFRPPADKEFGKWHKTSKGKWKEWDEGSDEGWQYRQDYQKRLNSEYSKLKRLQEAQQAGLFDPKSDKLPVRDIVDPAAGKSVGMQVSEAIISGESIKFNYNGKFDVTFTPKSGYTNKKTGERNIVGLDAKGVQRTYTESKMAPPKSATKSEVKATIPDAPEAPPADTTTDVVDLKAAIEGMKLGETKEFVAGLAAKKQKVKFSYSGSERVVEPIEVWVNGQTGRINLRAMDNGVKKNFSFDKIEAPKPSNVDETDTSTDWPMSPEERAASKARPDGVVNLDGLEGDELKAAIDKAIADKKPLKFSYHDKPRLVRPLEVWTNPKTGKVNLRAVEAEADTDKNFTLEKIGKPVDEKIKQIDADDIINMPQEQLDDVVDALWPAAAPSQQESSDGEGLGFDETENVLDALYNQDLISLDDRNSMMQKLSDIMSDEDRQIGFDDIESVVDDLYENDKITLDERNNIMSKAQIAIDDEMDVDGPDAQETAGRRIVDASSSTAVSRVEYDPATKELFIQFKSSKDGKGGGVYKYSDVAPEFVDRLESGSIGKMIPELKKNNSSEKLDEFPAGTGGDGPGEPPAGGPTSPSGAGDDAVDRLRQAQALIADLEDSGKYDAKKVNAAIKLVDEASKDFDSFLLSKDAVNQGNAEGQIKNLLEELKDLRNRKDVDLAPNFDDYILDVEADVIRFSELDDDGTGGPGEPPAGGPVDPDKYETEYGFDYPKKVTDENGNQVSRVIVDVVTEDMSLEEIERDFKKKFPGGAMKVIRQRGTNGWPEVQYDVRPGDEDKLGKWYSGDLEPYDYAGEYETEYGIPYPEKVTDEFGDQVSRVVVDVVTEDMSLGEIKADFAKKFPNGSMKVIRQAGTNGWPEVQYDVSPGDEEKLGKWYRGDLGPYDYAGDADALDDADTRNLPTEQDYMDDPAFAEDADAESFFDEQMFDSLFDTPDGAYKLNVFEAYRPVGRTTEDSEDFTDDPDVLATKFDVTELGRALAQAVLPITNDEATGYGNLPFESGDEPVKAEALYEALAAARMTPNIVLAGLYDSMLDPERGLTNVERITDVSRSDSSLDNGIDDPYTSELLPVADRSAEIDAAIALNEKIGSYKYASNGVQLMRNHSENNQKMLDIAKDLTQREDDDVPFDTINLIDLLDKYLPWASSSDANERDAFRGLWGMMMSLDGGSSIESDSRFEGFRREILSSFERRSGNPTLAQDDYDEFVLQYGGFPEFVAGKKAIADGQDDLSSETSAAAFYRLIKASSRPNTFPLWRSIGVAEGSSDFEKYTVPGSRFDMDPRSFTSQSLETGTFGDIAYSPTDKKIERVIFRLDPGDGDTISAESVSWFPDENENFASGSFQVVEVTRQKSQLKGRNDDYVVHIRKVDSDNQADEQSALPAPGQFIEATQHGDISGWTQVGNQAGSNPGGFYDDPAGNHYYIKKARSQSHADNEALASAFYKELGVPAAEVGFGEKDGVLHLVTPLIDGAKPDFDEKVYGGDSEYVKKVQDNFAVDAWLANYDVVGMVYDNVVSDANGEPVRVDPGGSLMWRAQGKPKTWFGDTVDELDSMRDPDVNDQAANVFGTMSDDQIKASAQKVANLTPDRIEEIIDSVVTDPEDAALLKERLLNRRQYIMDRFGFEEPTDVLGEPQSIASEMGIASKDLQAGDVTVGDSFVIERIFTDADTKKGKVSVQGYFPGHESQVKQWNENTVIMATRGGQLPAKGDAPALHRPVAPAKPQNAAFTGSVADALSGAKSWDEVRSILRGKEIVFFDYETTGFPDKKTGDNSTNQPVQLGAVKVVDGQIVDRFNLFMNPEEPLGGWSRDNLKGADGTPLTDEQLATAMDKGEAHQQFIAWAGQGAILAAHNAPFDIGVLNDTLGKKGLEFTPSGVIDTLKLAQTVIASKKAAAHHVNKDQIKTGDPSGPDTHRLGDLASHFGVELGDGWHTADADSEATSNVAAALIDYAAGLDDADVVLRSVLDAGDSYQSNMAEFEARSAQFKDELANYEIQKAIAAAWNCRGGTVASIAALIAAIDDPDCNVPSIDDLIKAATPGGTDFVDPEGLHTGDSSTGDAYTLEAEEIPEMDGIDPPFIPGIEDPDDEFRPSDQQQAVVEALFTGGDIVIRAAAGAGKTSTLKILARRLQKHKPKERVAYIAFNTTVADEARESMPSNVEVRTADSISFNWVKLNFPKLHKKKGAKDTLYSPSDIAAHLKVPAMTGMDNKGKPTKLPVSESVKELRKAIYQFTISADTEIGPQHFDPEAVEASDMPKLVEAAERWWADILSENGKMLFGFNHMKKMWALSNPDLSDESGGLKTPASVIFMDEAQDINPVLGRVIAAQTAQKIYVGDENQAIYQFMGAESELDKVEVQHDLPLTKSYRFGEVIARNANRYLRFKERFLGEKKTFAVEGAGKFPGDIVESGSMKTAQAVLVRSNAGAFREVRTELLNDRIVGVTKGFKADLDNFIIAVDWLQAPEATRGSRPMRVPEELRGYKNWAEIVDEAAKEGDSEFSRKTRILVDDVEQLGLEELKSLASRVKVLKGKVNTKVVDDGSLPDIPNDLSPGVEGDVGRGITFSVEEDGIILGGKTFDVKDQIKTANGGPAKYDGTRKAWVIPAKTDEARQAGLEKLQKILSPETVAEASYVDVVVSTVHQAKGAEWDDVRMGNDFFGPRKPKKSDGGEDADWIMPTPVELNLAYVGVTRAKKTLDPGSLDWIDKWVKSDDPEIMGLVDGVVVAPEAPEAPEAPTAASEDDSSAPTTSPDVVDEVAETVETIESVGEAVEGTDDPFGPGGQAPSAEQQAKDLTDSFDELSDYADSITDPEGENNLKTAAKGKVKKAQKDLKQLQKDLEEGSITQAEAATRLQQMIDEFPDSDSNTDEALDMWAYRQSMIDLQSVLTGERYMRPTGKGLPPRDAVDSKGRPVGFSKDGKFLRPGTRVRDKWGFSGVVDSYNENDWINVNVRYDIDPRDPDKVKKGKWGPGVARVSKNSRTLTVLESGDREPWIDNGSVPENKKPKQIEEQTRIHLDMLAKRGETAWDGSEKDRQEPGGDLPKVEAPQGASEAPEEIPPPPPWNPDADAPEEKAPAVANAKPSVELAAAADDAGVSLDAYFDESFDKDDVEQATNSFSLKKTGHGQAADAVIYRKGADGLEVLMISREYGPFRGAMALPGGFRDGEESFPDTADREMSEEVGVTAADALKRTDLGTVLDSPDWDPRFVKGMSVGAVAYEVDGDVKITAGDDATGATWVPMQDLANGKYPIAFGHATWLAEAFRDNPKYSSKFEVLKQASKERNARVIEKINAVRSDLKEPVFEQYGPEAPDWVPEGPGRWRGAALTVDSDGVTVANDIAFDDIEKLKNGSLQPPALPFFIPRGSEDAEEGEGYYFAESGKRYWGRFGAQGALVRKIDENGETKYLLGKRADWISAGGGKWAYPGGAHKNKEDSLYSAKTAMLEAKEELGLELGGELSYMSLKYDDQIEPDWSYQTAVFDATSDNVSQVSISDNETSEIGWFTAEQINDMNAKGELHPALATSIGQILKMSEAKPPRPPVKTWDVDFADASTLPDGVQSSLGITTVDQYLQAEEAYMSLIALNRAEDAGRLSALIEDALDRGAQNAEDFKSFGMSETWKKNYGPAVPLEDQLQEYVDSHDAIFRSYIGRYYEATDDKKMDEAHEMLLRGRTIQSGGGSVIERTGRPVVEVPLDELHGYDKSNFKTIPGLLAAVKSVVNKKRGKQDVGISSAIDSGDIEDLEVRATTIVDTNGERKLRLRYTLTSWAGSRLAQKLQNDEAWAKVLPRIAASKLDENGNVVMVGGVAEAGSISADYSNGTAYTYDSEDQGGKVDITLTRATNDPLEEELYYNTSGREPNAIHNQVIIDLPLDATEEDIFDALVLGGVQNPRLATAKDAEILIENRLLSLFWKQTNAVNNMMSQGERNRALATIEKEWGVTPADVEVVLGPQGRIEYLLPESVANSIVDSTGVKYLNHTISTSAYRKAYRESVNEPGFVEYEDLSPEQRADVIAAGLLEMIEANGLVASVTRFNEGRQYAGMSSGEDISSGGADYVFFSPSTSLGDKTDNGSPYRIEDAELVFTGEKLFRRSDMYANKSDSYGKRADDRDIIDHTRPGADEFMVKHGASLDDARSLATGRLTRLSLIRMAKEKGITKIGGRDIEDFVVEAGEVRMNDRETAADVTPGKIKELEDAISDAGGEGLDYVELTKTIEAGAEKTMFYPAPLGSKVLAIGDKADTPYRNSSSMSLIVQHPNGQIYKYPSIDRDDYQWGGDPQLLNTGSIDGVIERFTKPLNEGDYGDNYVPVGVQKYPKESQQISTISSIKEAIADGTMSEESAMARLMDIAKMPITLNSRQMIVQMFEDYKRKTGGYKNLNASGNPEGELVLSSFKQLVETGSYIAEPAILETKTGEFAGSTRVVYSVEKIMTDNIEGGRQIGILVMTNQGGKIFPMDSSTDLTFDIEKNIGVFSSRGIEYKIRGLSPSEQYKLL